MLTNIYMILKQTFGAPALFFFLFFVIIIPILIICTIICILEDTARPPQSQYPFNTILDYVAPLMFIFIPSLFIFYLNINILTRLEKFLILIIIHCFIVIPLMFFWSRHRRWDNNKESKLMAISHPIMLCALSIAMIYPLIWGLFFNILRFMRLDQVITINITTIIHHIIMHDLLYLIIFTMPCLLLWLLFFIKIITTFRQFLWQTFLMLVHAVNLKLLHYKIYFKLIEKLYKFAFIFYNFVSLNAPLNRNKHSELFSKSRQLINLVYWKPFISYILVFSFIISEILITFTLKYSFIVLFIFSILIMFCRALLELNNYDFIRDVCLIDYLNLDLNKIRYPSRFWVYIENPELFYGFSIPIGDDVYTKWETQYTIEKQKYKYCFGNNSARTFSHLNKITVNVLGYNHYKKRLKIAYLMTYNVRWFSVTVALKSPFKGSFSLVRNPFHPIVLHACNTPLKFLALLDSNIPFNAFEKKANNSIKDFSNSFFTLNEKILLPKPKKFIHLLESGHINSLSSLTKENVTLGDVHQMRLKFNKPFNSSVTFHSDIAIDVKKMAKKTAKEKKEEYLKNKQASAENITTNYDKQNT